ncbi:hypothetical protein [Cellulomonas phragmiteti]|uniref:hypothetical protein n=1 Tax=Cellulomonas phragmiteti TaxID=478780 RepID=UPI001940DC2A|nr:hypothetical protein [Cellulomonas phragmiteti]
MKSSGSLATCDISSTSETFSQVAETSWASSGLPTSAFSKTTRSTSLTVSVEPSMSFEK